MRSKTGAVGHGYLFVPLVALLIVAGLVSVSAAGIAQDAGGPTPAEARLLGFEAAEIPLPITAVSLFTTGVGYFQHDGVVEGTQVMTLTVASGDINDILKSLVLQDLDGGRVEVVSYPSQDPLQRILNSFSLAVGDNPSLDTLLSRARGEEVVIEGPTAATGTVFGLEYTTVTEGETSRRVPVINLLVDGAFRQIPLDTVRSIRFVDPVLQEELQSALHLIADNRQADRKSIQIRFAGEGRRRVRLGYIREVPVWKSSYRLVLRDDGTAQLQGWAIVENTGETDWSDIRLSLIAERPISFAMDLYTPIYNRRPQIRPEVGTSVAPPTYDRGVAQAPSAPSVARSMASEYAADEEALAFAPEGYAGSGYAERDEPIDLSQGVSAAVLAGEAAAFTISHGVSIPRRGAALIPIVSATIPIERLAIYDASALGNRPLSGLRMTNATETQLLAGPVTIFDGARYAGDARLPDLVPDEERLLSYAVDLATTVLVRSESVPQQITRVRIVRGVLETTLRQERTTEYVFDRIARDDADAVPFFFFHPKRSGWTLIGDLKPADETAGQWRFQVAAPATSTTTARVVEEYVYSQTYALVSLSDDQIAFYLSQRTIDDESAAQLRRIRELQGNVRTREAERRAIETEINTIYREQQRIRSNMEVLDPQTDLYKRYLQTFTSQEDRLEVLNRNLTAARDAEQRARDALAAYVESLE